ncbi:uncharacterized [Tachysurus ichikawai]
MGYPVSCQDQISSRVPFGGFGSTPFTKSLSGLITEVHVYLYILHYCCLNKFAQWSINRQMDTDWSRSVKPAISGALQRNLPGPCSKPRSNVLSRTIPGFGL